jgi:hypothetical protein
MPVVSITTINSSHRALSLILPASVPTISPILPWRESCVTGKPTYPSPALIPIPLICHHSYDHMPSQPPKGPWQAPYREAHFNQKSQYDKRSMNPASGMGEGGTGDRWTHVSLGQSVGPHSQQLRGQPAYDRLRPCLSPRAPVPTACWTWQAT